MFNDKISFAEFAPGDPHTFEWDARVGDDGPKVLKKTRDRIPEEAGVLHAQVSLDEYMMHELDQIGYQMEYLKKQMCQQIARALYELCEVYEIPGLERRRKVYRVSVRVADLGRLHGAADRAEKQGRSDGFRNAEQLLRPLIPQVIDDFGNVISR